MSRFIKLTQPPSGGCVLKQLRHSHSNKTQLAAAFGRLCVETGGRLLLPTFTKAAAFGRLCVETLTEIMRPNLSLGSRLRAAVC